MHPVQDNMIVVEHVWPLAFPVIPQSYLQLLQLPLQFFRFVLQFYQDLIDMKVLRDHIKNEVEDYLDHKNLNIQVPEFSSLNPTAEHIAYVIWNRLTAVLPKELEIKVTLYETPRNYVEYSGL